MVTAAKQPLAAVGIAVTRVPPRQRQLQDCLEQLVEAEGLLASALQAERVLANVRQALAKLCAEDGVPLPETRPPEPEQNVTDLAHAGTEVTPARARTHDEQKEDEPGTGYTISDQVILDTMRGASPKKMGPAAGSGGTSSARRRKGARRGYHMTPCCWERFLVPVFHPDVTFFVVWDFLALIFIFYETYALPFFLSFQVHPTGMTMWLMNVINVYFIVDIPLNFLRGFKNESGTTVMNLKRIAQRYIRWLPIDVLAGIPWEWLDLTVHGHNWAALLKLLRIARAARLLRLLRMDVLPEKAKIFIESSSWMCFLQGVMRVLFCLAGITHWAACIWFYIGSRSSFEKTWISEHLPTDSSLDTQYAYALYFTLTTMTTVGYGDITPQNLDEVCFTLVLLLVATVVFATLMGALTDLICSLQSDKHTQDSRVRMLSHYMNWRNVRGGLFKAIRSHMMFLWETHKGYDSYEEDVKEHLPPVLRKELCYHVYGDMLRSVPFLAWVWDYEVCLKELAHVLKPVILSQGDRLFRYGSPNENIFLLRSGKVRLSLNESLFANPFEKADEDEEEGQEEVLEKAEQEDLFQPFQSTGLKKVVLKARARSLSHTSSWDQLGSPYGTPRIAAQQDLFHPQVLQSAVEKMQDQDEYEKWAALLIQRRWRSKRQACQKARTTTCHSITSRSVTAPAYFGESCLWVPFDKWDTEELPTHAYSARSEETSEFLVIPRVEVQNVINSFSPWLQERFEQFRTNVLAGFKGERQQQHEPTFGVPPDKPAREGAIDKPASRILRSKTMAAVPAGAESTAEEICSNAAAKLTALASRSRLAARKLVGKVDIGSAGGNENTPHSWATLRDPLLRHRGTTAPIGF